MLAFCVHLVNLVFFNRKPQLPSLAPFNVTMNDVGMSNSSYKWRRVLLKVSGEALAGDQAQNIDPKVARERNAVFYFFS